MNMSDKPLANPDIVFREEFDDWAILFDPDTGDAFGMNPVSVFIWKQLNGINTIQDISDQLNAGCENTPENVHEHVEAFISELSDKGFAGLEFRIS